MILATTGLPYADFEHHIMTMASLILTMLL